MSGDGVGSKLNGVWQRLRCLAWMYVQPQGRIAEVSVGMEELLGYCDGELQGKKLPEMFVAEEQKSELPEAQSVLAVKEAEVSFAAVWTRKDGQRLPVWVSYVRLERAAEGAEMVFGVPMLVIVNAQIPAQALRMAEEVSINKVRTISHRLRTPLTVINLSANMLRNYAQRMSKEEQANEFFQISSAIDTAQSMLDEALAVTGQETPPARTLSQQASV